MALRGEWLEGAINGGDTKGMVTDLSSDDAGFSCEATEGCEKSSRSAALTVLIAEDDEMVRALAATVLRMEGFVVIPACNAEAAIEVFQSGVNIDALLTDNQMGGGLTGIMLAEHILRERPGLRVLVMSGFPETERSARERNLPFMAKPFKPAELAERIRQLVEQDT